MTTKFLVDKGLKNTKDKVHDKYKERADFHLRDSSRLKSALHDSSPIWVELSLKRGQQFFRKNIWQQFHQNHSPNKHPCESNNIKRIAPRIIDSVAQDFRRGLLRLQPSTYFLSSISSGGSEHVLSY